MVRGITLLVSVLTLMFIGQAALAQPGMMPQGMPSREMAPLGPMMSAPTGPGALGHMGPGIGPHRMGHHRGRGGMMRPGFFLRFKAQLGLSNDQVLSLRALRSEHAKQAIRRYANIKIARLELKDLLAEETWNVPRAEEKIRQISRIRTQARLTRLHALARARDILTPEQRKKLTELRGWRRY